MITLFLVAFISGAPWLQAGPPRAAGQCDDEKACREVLKRTRREWGEADARVAAAVIDLASILEAQGKAKAVGDLYYLEIDVSRKNADRGNTRTLAQAFAEWLMKSRRPADAESIAGIALTLGLKTLSPGDWRLGLTRSFLGETLSAQGKFAKAEPLLLEGQKNLAAASEAPDEARKDAIGRLVDLYEAWERASPGQGKMAEAARWKAQS